MPHLPHKDDFALPQIGDTRLSWRELTSRLGRAGAKSLRAYLSRLEREHLSATEALPEGNHALAPTEKPLIAP